MIGVIVPGAREAVRRTKGRKIGVIGTTGTIGSRAYERAIAEIGPGCTVEGVACPLFVPLAEEGWTEGDVPRRIARTYLEPLRGSGVDTVILGCTHYPLLRAVIAEALGHGDHARRHGRGDGRRSRAASSPALDLLRENAARRRRRRSRRARRGSDAAARRSRRHARRAIAVSFSPTFRYASARSEGASSGSRSTISRGSSNPRSPGTNARRATLKADDQHESVTPKPVIRADGRTPTRHPSRQDRPRRRPPRRGIGVDPPRQHAGRLRRDRGRADPALAARDAGKGWVTAEYGMLPAAVPERAARGKVSGRSFEIQRLIGRCLRAVVDLARPRRAADHRRLRRARRRRRDARRLDHGRLGRAPRLPREPAGREADRHASPEGPGRRRQRRPRRRPRDCSTSRTREDSRAQVDLNIVGTLVGTPGRGAGGRGRGAVRGEGPPHADADRPPRAGGDVPRAGEGAGRSAGARDGPAAAGTGVAGRKGDQAAVKLVLATNNRDKVRELRHALDGLAVRILTRDDYPGHPGDRSRTARPWRRTRSRRRAPSARRRDFPRSPTTPGSRSTRWTAPRASISSRFAGPGVTYADNVRELLRRMEGVPRPQRTARFRCVIALVEPGGAGDPRRGGLRRDDPGRAARGRADSATIRSSWCRRASGPSPR